MQFQQKIVTETIDNGADKVLVVLHGYGQLAKFFIKKFEHLKEYDILAIQAPNLFYLNGFSGRVGANWMTKENREEAILCQRKILLAVKEYVADKYQSVSLCAFSQGVATGSRWIMWDLILFDRVLLYAGEIAPEAFDWFAQNNLERIRYVVGNEDEFFSSEKVDAYQKKLNSVGIPIELEKVVGTHSIDKEIVKSHFEEN